MERKPEKHGRISEWSARESRRCAAEAGGNSSPRRNGKQPSVAISRLKKVGGRISPEVREITCGQKTSRSRFSALLVIVAAALCQEKMFLRTVKVFAN